MPGLVAIVVEPLCSDLAARLDQMLAPLSYPGYQTVSFFAPEWGVAMGWTGPRRLAPAGPGCWPPGSPVNAAKVVALVEGEPQFTDGMRAELDLSSVADRTEMAAALYTACGIAGFAGLRGHWAIAVLDRRSGTLLLANDHFGTRGLFRCRSRDGAWLIATHPSALLAYPQVERDLNLAGVADYLAFGHALGRKTIFQGIERLPGAICLAFRHGELSETRYWRPLPPPIQPEVDTADLEEVRQLFNHSVERALAAGGATCLALTGGMDARAILSATTMAGLDNHTLTHSVPDSTDAVLSAELARRAHATHHFFEVRGEMLPPQLVPGVRLLGGIVAGVDVHPLCFLDDLRRFTDVVITGLGADVMRLDHSGVDIVPGRDTPELLVEDMRRYHNSVFDTRRDLPVLLDSAAMPDGVLNPVQSIAEYIQSRLSDIPLDEIGAAFFLEERVPTIWVKGDLIVRRELETRHPFLDPDLLTRAWALPRPARLQALAHRYMITRNAPALADVPYERDGLPLRYPFTPVERQRLDLQRWQRQLAGRLGRRWERRPNYRYGDWFRGPLRPLLAEVLLDARTQSRPYFRPGAVRRFFDEHMAGHDHTVRLAALLSLELTIRIFVERNGF
ncbi:MAG: asparagine synthase-related protein [Anaerolineae bacterium]|nr:asparagine synthase-related protein [Anaerolineae bacterium]